MIRSRITCRHALSFFNLNSLVTPHRLFTLHMMNGSTDYFISIDKQNGLSRGLHIHCGIVLIIHGLTLYCIALKTPPIQKEIRFYLLIIQVPFRLFFRFSCVGGNTNLPCSNTGLLRGVRIGLRKCGFGRCLWCCSTFTTTF